MTSCIDYISLDQSVANYVGVCSTGKRKSHHYYIRHFLSWRTQWFFFSPLGRKISHAKIFQALPSGLLPQGLIHCYDFPLKITLGKGIDGFAKRAQTRSHTRRIFLPCVLSSKSSWFDRIMLKPTECSISMPAARQLLTRSECFLNNSRYNITGSHIWCCVCHSPDQRMQGRNGRSYNYIQLTRQHQFEGSTVSWRNASTFHMAMISFDLEAETTLWPI